MKKIYALNVAGLCFVAALLLVAFQQPPKPVSLPYGEAKVIAGKLDTAMIIVSRSDMKNPDRNWVVDNLGAIRGYLATKLDTTVKVEPKK